MLLVIQFPLADARRFLTPARRIPKPVWPIATPDVEFVRAFGLIRKRHAGGLVDWGGANENIICEAKRALTFQQDLSFSEPHQPATARYILRKAFQRFYFDGYAVGKFEVGIATKKRAKVATTPQQTRDLIDHFLRLPVHIPNPAGQPQTSVLSKAGKPLAALYVNASTQTHDRPLTPIPAWYVQPGAPILFLESPLGEAMGVPVGARRVPLPESSGLRLFRFTASHAGRTIEMWMLGYGDNADPEKMRTLRLYLLRLHSEHECLRLILRQVMEGNIKTTRGTQASDDLQQYFDTATARIKALESKSEQQFTAEIGEFARKATDLLNPGIVDTLLASVKDLEPRKNVMRVVQEYVAAGVTQFTYKEGDHVDSHDTISVSGTSGGVVNIKGTISAITQNIGALPNADQATKDELNHLVEQLSTLLQKAPAAKSDDAGAVAEAAKQAIDAVSKEKVNKSIVQNTVEGLKRAAENIKEALPDILPVATRIGIMVLKVAGIFV